MIQLAKKIFWAGQRPAVCDCGKNISKTRWRHWRKHWNVRRIPIKVGIWFHSLSLPAFVVAMAFSIAGTKIVQKMWEGPCSKGVWPCVDPWDVVRLRTSSSSWNVPEKSGPHSKLFFFLIRKETGTLTVPVEFKPFVPAETLRACALIGLHLMAAEGEAGSSGSQSPVLGDMWSKVAHKAQLGTATDTFSLDKSSPITCKVRFFTLCPQKSDEETPSLSHHDSSLLLEDWAGNA